MYLRYFFYFLFILSTVNVCSTQGNNSTNSNETSTVTAATLTTNTLCPKGYIKPPKCAECEPNYERKENECVLIKSQIKPTRSTARRIFILFLGCLLTICLITAMIAIYRRLIGQNNRPLSTNLNIGSRFNNILQSIGLNNLDKRGRFNFFSISNNNHSSGGGGGGGGHHRQPETSRTHLSENQDEALLFDDPYADGGISGGIHGSSANPYKSLTLSVT